MTSQEQLEQVSKTLAMLAHVRRNAADPQIAKRIRKDAERWITRLECNLSQICDTPINC